MPAPKRKPVPKKLLFAQEYLKDTNGLQAAIRAGYSPHTAHAQACRMLKDVEVQAFITEHTKKRMQRLEIDADRWLQEINTAAFLDPDAMFNDDGTLLPISQMPEASRRAIAGFEVIETFEWEGEGKDKRKVWTGYLKKVKLVSKEGTLNLCARHLGILNDKVTVFDGDLVSKLDAAIARTKGVK